MSSTETAKLPIPAQPIDWPPLVLVPALMLVALPLIGCVIAVAESEPSIGFSA